MLMVGGWLDSSATKVVKKWPDVVSSGTVAADDECSSRISWTAT